MSNIRTFTPKNDRQKLFLASHSTVKEIQAAIRLMGLSCVRVNGWWRVSYRSAHARYDRGLIRTRDKGVALAAAFDLVKRQIEQDPAGYLKRKSRARRK
jgi:hypothetical protein